MDMDGIIHLTEARRVRRAALQDHLYIHRYPHGLQDYLRNRLRHSALVGVGTSEKGREIGNGNGNESGGGSESEGDLEGKLREAGMRMEGLGAAVGVCRIHRVRAYVGRVFPITPSCTHHALEPIFVSHALRRFVVFALAHTYIY